jgi:hypothetical protein
VNVSANGASTTWQSEVVWDYQYIQGASSGYIDTGIPIPPLPRWPISKAASQGAPPVGFLNPALYSIAAGPSYTSCLHDITSGNNTNSNTGNLFQAGPGYDNCTGLGSSAGLPLINALVGFSINVFVNFNYTGSPQNGSYDYPFPTLAKDVSAVGSGGSIFIETAGTSPETLTITKPMPIVAMDGPATVGRSRIPLIGIKSRWRRK